MQLNEISKLLSETEVEKATGGKLKRRTLQYWRLVGEGPAYIKLGRRCFYHPDAITAFVGGGAK